MNRLHLADDQLIGHHLVSELWSKGIPALAELGDEPNATRRAATCCDYGIFWVDLRAEPAETRNVRLARGLFRMPITIVTKDVEQTVRSIATHPTLARALTAGARQRPA